MTVTIKQQNKKKNKEILLIFYFKYLSNLIISFMRTILTKEE